MTDHFAVDIQACRARQERLIEQLQRRGLEMALLSRPASVQWLTGAHVGQFFEMMAAIHKTGEVTLAVPVHVADARVAADHVVSYDAQRLCTLRDDQRQACGHALLEKLSPRPTCVGGELGFLNQHLTLGLESTWVDMEADVLRLRRHKDPDELRMLNRANDANRAMYERAREIIEPGIDELSVYLELQATAVRELGETLTYFGQDFQCNSAGGPPRSRRAEQGELYILDLGVGFRGYYSDNCRTLLVGAEPDDRQQAAYEAITQVFDYVESTVGPGTSCRQLYADVKQQLSPYQPWSFPHHLGHGVGLASHESPRLNPNWDDTLAVGDFFAVEPGLYHEELRYGIRLEQNYLVTENGVKLMTDWRLEL